MFRGHAATTVDFQAVVERHIGMPMDWFFDEWVRGTAIPTYHVAWTSEPAEEGGFRVHFRISQEHVPADFRAYVPVAADLGGGRTAHFRIQVRGAQGEYRSPPLPAQPRNVVFDALHGVLANVEMERW
jgi:aminopeptidase N